MNRRMIPRVLIPLLLGGLVTFTVIRSQRESMPLASGILERDRIELPAKAMEQIGEIFVSEGEQVRQGQILLQLDTARSEANLQSARADRMNAEAALEKVRNGTRPEEINQVKALLEAAEGILIERERNLERLKKLNQQNFSSTADKDAAESLWIQALGSRNELKARLNLLVEGSRPEDLKMAEAALEAAEARETLAALALDDLTLKAPEEGVVDSLPLKKGATPLSGQTLAVLLTGEIPYARVYIPEEQISSVTIGMELPLQIDGNDKTFQGTLRRLSSAPVYTPYFALNQSDRGHLSYLAIIDIRDPDAAHLAPGTPVRVPLEGKP